MRKLPTRARVGARDALLQAATQLLARNPGATLEEVSLEAGVGRATLFRYFPTRSELLREVGVAAMARLEGSLDQVDLSAGSSVDKLGRLVDALVPWGEQLRFLLVASELYEDEALARAEERIDARILPVFRAAKADGTLRADIPDGWLFEAFEALLYASWTAVAKGGVARKDAGPLLLETLLHGFGGRP